MTQDEARRLMDLEEIRRLKAQYCRFIDTKQWNRLRAIFAADVRFEGLGSAPTGARLDDFIKGISGRMATAVAIHHVHNPEIVFTGPDTARGVWAMMDFVDWPDGPSPREAPEARGFMGFGHYEEEYRRIGGVWKIAFLRLTRLRVDPVPHGHPRPKPGLLAHAPDWLPGD